MRKWSGLGPRAGSSGPESQHPDCNNGSLKHQEERQTQPQRHRESETDGAGTRNGGRDTDRQRESKGSRKIKTVMERRGSRKMESEMKVREAVQQKQKHGISWRERASAREKLRKRTQDIVSETGC